MAMKIHWLPTVLWIRRCQTLVLLGHEGPCFIYFNDRGPETTDVLSGEIVAVPTGADENAQQA